VGASSFDHNWVSSIPVADVPGFFVLLLSVSEGFHFHLLCLWNSLLDGGSVMVVLAVRYTAAFLSVTGGESPGFRLAFDD
jgi:hypothetical protein